jgi:cytochrome c biogenesis protein CcmG/thiol:disulfide interchange protein DsbE
MEFGSIDIQTGVNSEQPEKSTKRIGRILAWIAAWVGLIALLGLLFFGLTKKSSGPIQIGSPAPDFSLTAYDGRQYLLSDLKGKVVLVNFWASWCKPCEQEAADLEAAWQYYQPGGEVIFLGIDWTDTEKKGLEYLTRFEISYPNGPDLGTRISQAYRITGVPETYITDKNGNLAYAKISPFLSLDEILSAINPLLE